MFRKLAAPLVVLALAAAYPSAQTGALEPVNAEVNALIRKEGMDNSQIVKTMHFLYSQGRRDWIAL